MSDVKYAKGSFFQIKFSPVGTKKETSSGFESFNGAQEDLDSWLERNEGCSGVVARVISNSAYVEDKWSYNSQ